MYKKKKVADGGGSSRGGMDAMDEEMDFKKIMKDIELFSRLLTRDMEGEKGNGEQESNCSGWKSSKKRRLPLSVARPMMKKQKEREQTMLQERLILGQFGGKHGDSAKRSFGRRKPEDRVLKASEGHFRNGVLDVKHLLHPTNSSGDSDSSIHVVTKGKKKGRGKKNRGTKGGKKRH